MQFHTLVFIYLFLPFTLFFYYLAQKPLRNVVLLIASLIFSAWFQIYLTLILIGSIVVNYFIARVIEATTVAARKKIYLTLAILFDLLLLVVFKYTVFLGENISVILGWFGISPFVIQHFAMPLGISFYTFKLISYLVSVKRGEIVAERDFINLALYVSLFPQLAAGPIDRYSNLGPQLRSPSHSFDRFASGVRRFAIGLGKKVIIASPLALVTEKIFNQPLSETSAMLAWLGAICYTLQIYYDFSGYTDMAIGIGKMFGLEFTENFKFPYTSRSIREFWQRWHITLSTWLRDYLFLPLAYAHSRSMHKDRYLGLRTDHWIYIYATLITFFICGFWHGAAWTFLLWGLMHGFMLVIEQLGLGKRLRKVFRPVQHGYVLLFLIISWVFFRSPTVGFAFSYIGVMFGAGGHSNDINELLGFLDRQVIIVLIISVIGSTMLLEKFNRSFQEILSKPGNLITKAAGHSYAVMTILIVLLILALSTIFINAGTTIPFIYFKF